MLDLLLYSTINCIDAADMVSRVRKNDSVSESIQTEIVETLKEATPHCPWDAND